jgi:hypothetical protein
MTMTVKELMDFLSKQNPDAKIITTASQHIEYVEEYDPFGYCPDNVVNDLSISDVWVEDEGKTINIRIW